MKTTLLKTLLVLAIIAISTTMNAQTNTNLFKTIEVNSLGKPETITVKKSADEHKDYYKQYKLDYNDSGSLSSKETKIWNQYKKAWENEQKYIYEYNQNGELSYLISQKWNNKQKQWITNGSVIYYENNYLVSR